MLSSWKEIAHFFGKGVRTVQRWEKTLDLPIHRPPGAPSNVVLARTSDLEEWMHRGPVAKAVSEESTVEAGSAEMRESLRNLESEMANLATWAGVQVSHTDSDESTENRIGVLTNLTKQVYSALSSNRTARAA